MGKIHSQDFSGGWHPSVDENNCPPSVFPRLDNVLLDDLGILSLRRGISPVSGNAPIVVGGSVHSMFTINMNDIRYRYAGINDSVWKSTSVGSYSQILSGLTGAGDIHFGSDLGQVFIARGHDRYKNDGTNSKQWGVTQVPGTPSVSAIASDGKTFATFDNGESPAWVATEGVIIAAMGFDDTPEGSRLLTAGVQTGKAAMRKVFGAETNFTAYDGGDTGVDEDLVEFYLWMSRPDQMEYAIITFDVNGDEDSEGARFRDDYYYVELTLAEAVSIKLDEKTGLEDRFDVEAYDRENFVFDLQGVGGGKTREGGRIPRATPPAEMNSGWARYSIPRGRFIRVGSSNNKNWSTVKAIQVEYKATLEKDTTGTPIAACDVRFDAMRIIGGAHHALTGKYKVLLQARSQHAEYQGKAPSSAFSAEIELRANGLRVQASLPIGFDDQVTTVAAFIMGGTLNSMYFAKEVPAAHTISIDIDLSDRDILILNEKLDPSINNPPIDVRDIAGPFDQRIFILTSDAIHPSLPNNPDSFSANHVMTLPGKSTTAHWLRSILAEPVLGTSRDIYQIKGDGAISPDGIINYAFVPMNVPPPISDFVAQEGNLLIYMAADGPRIFNGTTSIPLHGNNDMLYQGSAGSGSARYGVSSPNLGSDPGRFRGGIYNNKLWMVTPEGTTDEGSPVVHVLRLGGPRWDRLIYPRGLQTLYREPDGKVLLGDTSGCIYQLDTLEGVGDQVVNVGGTGLTYVPIPITIYTPKHDNGDPTVLKAAEDLRADLTLNGTLTLQAVLDATSPSWAIGAAGFASDYQFLTPMEALEYRRIQLKFTGSFYAFKLRSWTATYRDRPMGRAHWDSGYIDLGGVREFVWLRYIKGMALLRGPVTIKVYLDDVLLTAGEQFNASSYPKLSDFTITYGRNIRGRQLRITMTYTGNSILADAFEPYWIQPWFRVSGDQSIQKKTIQISK